MHCGGGEHQSLPEHQSAMPIKAVKGEHPTNKATAGCQEQGQCIEVRYPQISPDQL